MCTRRSRSDGFTLIELLVALTVAGLVVAAAHGVLAFAIDSWAQARVERSLTLASAGARSALVQWLRAATLVEGEGAFIGREGGGGEYPLDELSFTVRDGGTLHPGRHRIRLWVERDPAAPRHGLLAELAPRGTWRAAPADTVLLAEQALGLSLRYLAVRENRLVWLSQWHSEEEAPLAVEVRVFAPLVAERFGGLPPLWSAPLRVRIVPPAP